MTMIDMLSEFFYRSTAHVIALIEQRLGKINKLDAQLLSIGVSRASLYQHTIRGARLSM